MNEVTDDQYEDFLNEIYGTIEICGIEFYAGAVLRKMDPTAFRVGKSDFANSLAN